MNPLERKLDALIGHVRFDERGVEIECMAGYSDTSHRKGWSRLRPSLNTTAPLLDSTYMYWHDKNRLGFANVLFVDSHVQYLQATPDKPDFQRGQNWSFIYND